MHDVPRPEHPRPEHPRPEHPRPDFQRRRWQSLNGAWSFAFDDADEGRAAHWERTSATVVDDRSGPFDRTITVPFAYQTPASGIGDRDLHEIVWYARVLPDTALEPHERLRLHIGASDHDTTVWINGELVAHHEGGYTPLQADITDALTGRGDVCVVHVRDEVDDLDKPRGKQYWRPEPRGVFYTGVTGIWQTVWTEVVGAAAVDALHVEPLLDAASIDLTAFVTRAAVGSTLRVDVSLDGGVVASDHLRIVGTEMRRRIRVSEVAEQRDEQIITHDGVAVWSPWTPTLYDIEVAVVDDDGTELDHVRSYFGMRSIEVRNDRVLLNGLPVYQRLVLDQGYFPEGGYTAVDDASLRRDIELAKEMGFIGCRKHQKIEDPRWLYWADRLGFLVWGELPSAHRFSARSVRLGSQQWQEVIARDRNHPCIVVWVPVNESWGAFAVGWPTGSQQVDHLRSLTYLTRSLDATRLVVSNDGWEHAATDLCTIHEYGDADALRRRLSSRARALDPGTARRAALAPGVADDRAPIVVSEMGGISLATDDGWGFHEAADGVDLLHRYTSFLAAVVAADEVVHGFCWTQLTDVEQETNGLLTHDRTPKVPIEEIRAATTQRRHGDV